MFTYLKHLFHDAIIQGQRYIGRNGQIREEIENNRNTVDSVHRREIPRPARDKTSHSTNENSIKNCDKEMDNNDNNMRDKLLRCYTTRFCEFGRKKKRNIVVEKKRRTREEKNDLSEGICRCENCSIVTTFNECGVCLEPLHTRGVGSCPVCANIVCSKCAEKLINCPYCRSSLPMQKNRAIERLLGGLFMPCKNARSGCRKMLNSEMRSRHEATCHHTCISCPVSEVCCWNGSPASILSHLKIAHGLKPLEDYGLTVEISSFRQKTMTREGEYTIYLSCYDQLFAVKITLCRKNLNLSFSQLGYVSRCTDKSVGKNYGVWIKMKLAGKRIRGILPFRKFDRETREIEINCETLCAEKNDISRDSDRIKIEISIREIKLALNK